MKFGRNNSMQARELVKSPSPCGSTTFVRQFGGKETALVQHNQSECSGKPSNSLISPLIQGGYEATLTKPADSSVSHSANKSSAPSISTIEPIGLFIHIYYNNSFNYINNSAYF